MSMGDVDLVVPSIMFGNIGRLIGDSNPHSTTRRALFGPVDHEENLRFVREEFSKLQQNDEKRWNFDFNSETPTDGRYEWTPVKDDEIIHPSYELKGLQCCKNYGKLAKSNSCVNVRDTEYKPSITGVYSSSKRLIGRKRNIRMQQTKMTEYLKKRKYSPESSSNVDSKVTAPVTKIQRLSETTI